MSRCFIIQPFDDDKFDRRFTDIFKPAIEKADLDPYRVDRDPTVNDLLDGIKSGIANCVAFLADITTDNPNVWYELGFAMSLAKPYCICCSEERTTSFPFDVGHLSIIKYRIGSSSYFSELEAKITERLKAVVTHEVKLQSLKDSTSTVAETEGLAPNEIFALTVLFQSQYDHEPGTTSHGLQSDMDKLGFTKTAANLALTDLLDKKLIEKYLTEDYNGNQYTNYMVGPLGVEWLRKNRDKLMLQKPAKKAEGRISDEDIPF